MEQNEELTPCQKLGYKEGDIFEVVDGGRFIPGERISLDGDDGTGVPKFTCVDRDFWHYEYLENVKKLEDVDKRNSLVEELQTQTKELIDLTNSMKEHGPIEWRDRIREIAVQMDQLQEERESLIKKLEDEGFSLIENINKSLENLKEKHEQLEDMSDWRNWKVGDFVEVLSDQGSVLCEILELEDDGYERAFPVFVKNNVVGAHEWPNISNMKWHSCPTI